MVNEPTYIGEVLGLWLRPWTGEGVTGEVFALSGDMLVCRAPGGVEFYVSAADVMAGRVKTYRSRADAGRAFGGDRGAEACRRAPRWLHAVH